MRLKTSDVARAIGVHPNTVRWYEAVGFLSPVERQANGYRVFREHHLLQAKIVKTSQKITWMSGPVREAALEILRRSRECDAAAALKLAVRIADELALERNLADEAVRAIERFRRRPGSAVPKALPRRLLRVGEAASLLGISADRVRDWERNGLLTVPRDPRSGYRLLGDEDLDRLRIIRLCRRAGYSTTAIRRSLRALDEGRGGAVSNLLDTPDPEEKAFFATFPTDRWLSTLREAEEALKTISRLLVDLEASVTGS